MVWLTVDQLFNVIIFQRKTVFKIKNFRNSDYLSVKKSFWFDTVPPDHRHNSNGKPLVSVDIKIVPYFKP